jgi:DNA polymerase elongation subunit (family B)
MHVKAKPVPEEDKITCKKYEYRVSYKNLTAFTVEECNQMPIMYPKIMSYDIEVFSSKAPAFPNASLSGDQVFQIGASMSQNIDGKREYRKILLTIGKCNPIKDDVDSSGYVDVRSFKNERALYEGFKQLMIEEDPDVVIGYNIFKFDIEYVHNRNINFFDASCSYTEFGCIRNKKSPIVPIKWESSAYGKQEMKYLDIEGRLMIDLFPYVVRTYKLTNYKLDTVANEFLKMGKDDVSASQIFELWKEGTPKSVAKVGKYCVQDTWVTLLLFEKLLVWFDLVESASVCNVPILYLYTKGQQIKIYSQLLKYCYHNNIVVQSKVYEVKEGDEFEGALVTQPISGIYKNILPFDFASLYPSIIQAYNIDYSKLVLDESVPDSACHVIEWTSHTNCQHDPKIIEKKQKKSERIEKQIERQIKLGKDPSEAREEVLAKQKETKKGKIVCGDFRFRFLKQDVSGKGIIPTLLETLLKARKDTRKTIQKNDEQIVMLKDKEDEESKKEIERLNEINLVLDKRQSAYKVSCNSMYGGYGIKVGYLPFMVGAMCVTAVGRQSITKASIFLENECGARKIYGDTDSCYMNFPHLNDKSFDEIWEHAHQVEERVKSLFPAPMSLDFEGKVYTKFFILTKKRYMAITKEPNKKEKLFKRGIVLSRRDNCSFLRTLYEQLVYTIFDNVDIFSIFNLETSLIELYNNKNVRELVIFIIEQIDKLFQFGYSHKDFVITKAMKSLQHKGLSDPGHILVAKKMIARGQPVEDNTRLEYLFLDNGDTRYKTTDKVAEKCEDVGYYLDNKEYLKIDFLSYIQRQCQKPIDEILSVGVKLNGLIEEQFHLRLLKKKYIYKLNDLFNPLRFES